MFTTMLLEEIFGAISSLLLNLHPILFSCQNPTNGTDPIRFNTWNWWLIISPLASNETSEIRNLEIIFHNIPIESLSISKCKYASCSSDHKVISSKLRMHLPPHHHLSLRIFMFECILTSPRRTSLLLLRIFYLLFMIIFHNYSWWATGCALSAKANPRLTLLLAFNISRSTSRS